MDTQNALKCTAYTSSKKIDPVKLDGGLPANIQTLDQGYFELLELREDEIWYSGVK